MSRIPRPLARRIDRLARAAHRFHRFAHHPLCDAYTGEVVRLGRRTRVCRGCLMTGLGGIAGAALGIAFALPVWPAALSLGVALGLGLASIRVPAWRAAGKLATRAAPAFALGFAATGAAHTGLVPAIAFPLASALVLAGLVALYRRRGPDRAACLSCPERTGTVACTGMRPIVLRERAVQRLAGRWIDAARV